MQHYEAGPGYAIFSPVGKATLPEAIALVTGALELAVSEGHRKLLVDLTDLGDYPSPSLSERYAMFVDWAKIAAGKVCLALVIREDARDPRKFGMTVGQNRGLHGDVFSSRAAAIAWLEDQ